ncbi:MAG: hypothetical protein K2W95_34890 [Candidatus Obscuribacterales bacterium]|nr:hypothetical protein [Candidatus Obscuribacterales bacterium]
MIPGNKLAEALEVEAHNKYLRKHLEEDPFPLDGSDWSRLVALRLQRSRHPHCCTWDNFLTRLHSSDSPLEREHLLHSTFLNYWFLNPYLHYPHLHEEGDEMKGWDRVELTKFMPEILEEVEKQWVHSPGVKLFEPSPSRFWIDEVTHDWRPAVPRHSNTSASLPLSDRSSCQSQQFGKRDFEELEVEEPLDADELLSTEMACQDYLLEVDRQTLDPLLPSRERLREEVAKCSADQDATELEQNAAQTTGSATDHPGD